MCRFMAYLGNPMVLHDILYKPRNSLIKQSIHARETEEPLNGDGFGVSWYVSQIDDLPGVFKTIQPAWNDSNLETLSAKIKSNCFLAHVRAASNGNVNVLNTHPFNYKQYSFMHNGDIGKFETIKRHIRRDLSDEIYEWIKGQTDSEHFFAIFLELLSQEKQAFNVNLGASILRKAIDYIETMQKKFQIEETTYINAILSDGKSLLAIRYVSDENEAASLHYSFGHRLEYQEGYCHMRASKNTGNRAVFIASEKLTSHKVDWHDVPTNHMLLVNENLETKIEAI
jgi:glutamine amidotransferase